MLHEGAKGRAEEERGRGGWRGSPDELVPGFWELESDGQTVHLGFGLCKIPFVGEPTRAWKLVYLQHKIQPSRVMC